MKRLCLCLGMLTAIVGLPNSEAQWVQTNGPGGPRSVSCLEASRYPRFLQAGTGNINGLPGGEFFNSTDNGTTWSRIGATDGVVTDIVSMLGDNFQALFWYVSESAVPSPNACAIHRSEDFGPSWEHVLVSGPDTGFTSLAVMGGKIFAGSDGGGVFRSTDLGETWAPTNSGLSKRDVKALAVSGTTLFAGTWGKTWTLDSCLFRSTDDGETWVPSSYAWGAIVRLAAEGGIIHASFVTNLTAEVYYARSTDNGSTWCDTWVLTPSGGVKDFFVAGTALFAAIYDSGVYQSTDHGVSWVQVNEGLPNTHVTSLAGNDEFIFVGIDSLVWRRPLSELVLSVNPTESSVPQGFFLGQNYPNPFNPSTTIRYSLPTRSPVQLAVFNTLGQLVATLVDGEKEGGNHEVKFDASGLSSGVYFYRLEAGTFVDTKKLLLIR